MEDEMRSFIINIPKPIVYARKSDPMTCTVRQKTKLPVYVSKRKPSNISLQKYSLPGSKPLPVNKLENDVLLLPYRLFSKRQESERHKTRLAIKIYDKYKIVSTDLRRRLHVESLPNEVQGLTDIDPKFFEYVNVRPLSNYIPLYKSLGPSLNSLFKIRHHTSFIKDCVLRIESNMRKELQTYEISVQRCKEQAQCFDTFISEDYLKSMVFLRKWDELKMKLNSKEAELQSLANDKFYIMSRLIGLDYRYSVQQKYGRLLYYLSPPTWRASHRDFARSVEIEKKGFDLGYSTDDDPFTVIFEKLKQESMGNPIAPVLYFQRPNDLMDMFESIEKQQLNYLTYVIYSSPYVRTLKKELVSLKSLIQQSSVSVVNAIKEFEDMLERENTRCNIIEAKFHKILEGMFYENVGSLEVLKMGLHLEYCYEKVLNEKPMNTDLVSLAKVLESSYMDYWKGLDEVCSDDIKKAVQRYIELERTKMRKARFAARELRLFRRLEKELRRTCLPKDSPDFISPPTAKLKQRTKSRMSQAPRPRTVTEASRESLTEAQLEYLALFTDWTANEDPANYLQALSEDKHKRTETKF
ncbi:uncharacterized protein LOC134652479 [Cydia amplana]|uniref:uncharacterized protein LOC134652479 n=1 Tax=Cydia amplana TaxID=1869771 RepID=UPI002FE61B5E